MARAKKSKQIPISRYITKGVSLLTISLAILLIIPVSTALSAGLASLSVVVFGSALIALVTLYIRQPQQERLLVGCAFIGALFGLLFPQSAFIIASQRENVSLTFNPISYVKFSGETTIRPTNVLNYKMVKSEGLEIAFYEGHGKSSSRRPAVMLLHGGGWRYGNHLETGDWPRILAEAGFSVFSIEYRLANDTYPTWRDAPQDVHDAYSFLQTEADSLGIDPARIHLMGQSAGGHLALLEAYLHNDAESVISLYSPIDLSLDYSTSRDKSAELDFLGGPPKQYPARYRAVSPITYVSSRAPRTLIVQGMTDHLVATRNATLLASSLLESRVAHEVVLLPMTGHSFENQRGGFATQITEASVLRFLSR